MIVRVIKERPRTQRIKFNPLNLKFSSRISKFILDKDPRWYFNTAQWPCPPVLWWAICGGNTRFFV